MKGIEVIFQEYKVEHAISESDLVVTGEGSYDKTTKAGKLVQHVCLPFFFPLVGFPVPLLTFFMGG
jgi:glycerate kinase